MENIWLISVAALVVGAIIGFLFGRSGAGNSRQAELAEQLENAKNELESYKADVSSHFEKTAELVNNLTHSYKDVHEHLAGGAQSLCQPGTVDLALEPSLQPKLEETTESPAATDTSVDEGPETPAEPPRDYAPKEPDEEGTLSETFGLKENSEEPKEEELDPPKDAAPPKEAAPEKTPA